jgi:DNA-binding NtrC family response regulator
MAATKVLIVANSPGILHRVEVTLAGLEVHTAIRLRDAARILKQGDFALVVFCLGFDEDDTLRLFAAIGSEPVSARVPIVCLAESPAMARASAGRPLIDLRQYPATQEGNAALRERVLAARLQAPTPRTPRSRTLERAALLVGGVGRLAAYLAVPERSLARWLVGEESPPESVFLDALDLVLTDLERRGRRPH